MQLHVLLFSQPACVAFFSCPIAFVSSASYSVLGQLSDAHWPNSARPSTNSVRSGNIGKATPLHCNCGGANVCGFSGGPSVTTDTQAVTQFNILLVSRLQCNCLKTAVFKVIHSVLHPYPNLLFHCCL